MILVRVACLYILSAALLAGQTSGVSAKAPTERAKKKQQAHQDEELRRQGGADRCGYRNCLTDDRH